MYICIKRVFSWPRADRNPSLGATGWVSEFLMHLNTYLVHIARDIYLSFDEYNSGTSSDISNSQAR